MAALSFFAQQERARRATATLVVLYAIAVAAIVASVNAIVWALCRLFSYPDTRQVFVITTLVTLAAIALGTVEILARLSLSRGAIAQLLSARPLGRGAERDDERRLANIVDEMSIASGLAAPPLYVLHREQGINAFAAGASPSQAVIIVTQGALEKLSRDELQAVIAHEFSHILNGDIRLNLRAVYVLQGIVFLSAIGRFMMRYYSGVGTDEGRRFFHLPFALLGIGVFTVGSVGLVFCRVIQASLARERENLADACAVQFTRNGDALCGALARIRVDREGSSIRNWHADALAHMLFAPTSHGWWRALIATHPPLEERMRRVNPHVSPKFYFEKAKAPRAEEGKNAAEAEQSRQEKEKPRTIVPRRVTGVAALIAAIGAPGAEHLEYASSLLDYLPPSIREALGDAPGAQAVMFGCLLDAEMTNRERQLRALREHCDEALARRAEVLAPILKELDRAYRLPLVALAVPTLKGLDAPAREKFMAGLRAVIEADGRITLGEFVLSTILGWTLLARARPAAGGAAAASEIAQVLSLVAHAGSDDADQALAAFGKGAAVLGLAGLSLTPKEELRLARTSQALERVSGLPAADKAQVLEACATAVAADDNVRLMEHELLRAVACVLECPMPPAIAVLDPRLLRK